MRALPRFGIPYASEARSLIGEAPPQGIVTEAFKKPFLAEWIEARSHGFKTCPLRFKNGENKSPSFASGEPFSKAPMTGRDFQRVSSGPRVSAYGIFAGWMALNSSAAAGYLAFIDCETEESSQNAMDRLAFAGIAYMTVRSGSNYRAEKKKGGGAHLYVLLTSPIGNSKSETKAIEIRGNGYVVGPGSLHADGGRYEIEGAPWCLGSPVTPAALREALHDLVPVYEPRPNQDLSERISKNTIRGQRSQDDMRITHAAIRAGIDCETLKDLYSQFSVDGSKYRERGPLYVARNFAKALQRPIPSEDLIFRVENSPIRPRDKATLKALLLLEAYKGPEFLCSQRYLALKSGITTAAARKSLLKHEGIGLISRKSDQPRGTKLIKLHKKALIEWLQTMPNVSLTPKPQEEGGGVKILVSPETFADVSSRGGLGMNGADLLRLISRNPGISLLEIGRLMTISRATIWRLLGKLENLQFVLRDGTRKNARYRAIATDKTLALFASEIGLTGISSRRRGRIEYEWDRKRIIDDYLSERRRGSLGETPQGPVGVANGNENPVRYKLSVAPR